MLARLVVLVAIAISIANAEAADWTSLRPKVVLTCRNTCQYQGVTPALCAQYCKCTTAGMESILSYENLSKPYRAMTKSEEHQMTDMTIDCKRRVLGQWALP